ncbi:MAG: hypothetical protein WC750_06415 [Patescibacteria group bacterium]|jgi:hypothetical protein
MDAVNEKALTELEEYKKQGCHMLIPTMGSLAALADGFRIIVSPEKILSNPKDGDVYQHDSTQWDKEKKCWNVPDDVAQVRFHAQAFQKLARAANIIWSNPLLTHDPKFPRALCEISGAVRKEDGSWRTLPDFYGSDLDIIKEELIAQNSFKGVFDAKKQWLVDRDFLQKRKNQDKSCITGAKNRVTARLLGLKNVYTVKELEQPFIFVQIVFVPDMQDREVRMLVTKANVLGIAMANVFGVKPSVQPAIEYKGDIAPDQCINDDVIDIEDGAETQEEADRRYTVGKDQPPEDVPSFAMDPEPEPTTAKSLRADFLNSEVESQVKTLLKMADQKGFSVMEWLKTNKQSSLEKMPASWRPALYDKLAGMPDKKAEGRAA